MLVLITRQFLHFFSTKGQRSQGGCGGGAPAPIKAPANLECSHPQAPYSAGRIDRCHKNSSQIIATVQPLVWARTLLNVCAIGCDIFGLDKAAQSTWASVQFHSDWARKQWKASEADFLFPDISLSDAALVGCRWFINLFRVVSSFDARRYFLLLWCRWQDVKGFAWFPPGLALGKGALDVVCRYCPLKSG